jgi:hypothetical protein
VHLTQLTPELFALAEYSFHVPTALGWVHVAPAGVAAQRVATVATDRTPRIILTSFINSAYAEQYTPGEGT